jgi:alcohol dehydrogenase (cytochrome c)
MIRKKLLTSAAAVTLCALISAQANGNTNKVTEPSFNPVKYTEIANDAKTTNDVLTYGLGQQGQRFSSL